MSAAVATAPLSPPSPPVKQSQAIQSGAIQSPGDLSLPAKALAFGAMCIGFFIALLDIQIVSASLKDIGGGLSASPDEVSWVQTSYLIAEIVVIPLSGWLSRVMSTRWLFCASAVGFTLASLLCGWAWDINSMIAFRALQGFLGGSMIPTAFTTAFFYFSGQQRVVAAAIIGAISSLMNSGMGSAAVSVSVVMVDSSAGWVGAASSGWLSTGSGRPASDASSSAGAS